MDCQCLLRGPVERNVSLKVSTSVGRASIADAGVFREMYSAARPHRDAGGSRSALTCTVRAPESWLLGLGPQKLEGRKRTSRPPRPVCGGLSAAKATHCASTTSVIKDDSSNGTCSPLVDLITSTRTRFITAPISRPGVVICWSSAVVNGLLRPSPSRATWSGLVANAVSVPTAF